MEYIIDFFLMFCGAFVSFALMDAAYDGYESELKSPLSVMAFKVLSLLVYAVAAIIAVLR